MFDAAERCFDFSPPGRSQFQIAVTLLVPDEQMMATACDMRNSQDEDQEVSWDDFLVRPKLHIVAAVPFLVCYFRAHLD